VWNILTMKLLSHLPTNYIQWKTLLLIKLSCFVFNIRIGDCYHLVKTIPLLYLLPNVITINSFYYSDHYKKLQLYIPNVSDEPGFVIGVCIGDHYHLAILFTKHISQCDNNKQLLLQWLQ
jgi:hypothetical protein